MNITPDMLKSFASVQFAERFDELVLLKEIDIELFKTDEGQEQLAFILMRKVADLLSSEFEADKAYRDAAVYFTLLNVLGAASPADIMNGGKQEAPKPGIQSAPGVYVRPVTREHSDNIQKDPRTNDWGNLNTQGFKER